MQATKYVGGMNLPFTSLEAPLGIDIQERYVRPNERYGKYPILCQTKTYFRNKGGCF